MLVPKMSLIELIEDPLKTGYKEILNKKVATIVLAENMASNSYHSPIIIKGTFTTMQEEMVVVGVEVPMPPSGSGYYSYAPWWMWWSSWCTWWW